LKTNGYSEESRQTPIHISLTGKKQRKGASTGTSIIIEKTRRPCKNQNVGLNLEGAFMIIKANRSQKEINSAVPIGRCLIQKIVRRRKIETLRRKEKVGATFATVEGNLASNKMLTEAITMKSDAFFRFTIAAKADAPSIPGNN
jgi:hypothetical protein